MFDTPSPKLPRAPAPTSPEPTELNPKAPITPRGKTIFSRNATRHGLASRQVVLPHESVDSYLALHRSHIEQLPPVKHRGDRSCLGHVHRPLALAPPRFHRERGDDIRRYVDNPGPDMNIAWTISRISGGTVLPLITRYESALQRTFDRALKQLQRLRAPQIQVPDKNIEQRTQDSGPQN